MHTIGASSWFSGRWKPDWADRTDTCIFSPGSREERYEDATPMKRPVPDAADSSTTPYVKLTFVGSKSDEDETELVES